MKQSKYDIFISYRREGGRQYARSLQLILEKKGYKVFLDYDELVDDLFQPTVEAAIRNSSVYLLLLSKGALDKCGQENCGIRKEIEIALDCNAHFVPIIPDGTYDGMPSDVPENIRRVVEDTQHSEVNFGQTLDATVDLMIKNRIRQYVKPRRRKRWLMFALLAVAVVTAVGYMVSSRHAAMELEQLKQSVSFENLSLSDEANKDEVMAVKEILQNMQCIEGGKFLMGAVPDSAGMYDKNVEIDYEVPAHEVEVKPFWINKFEVSISQWNAIMGDNRDGDPEQAVADVSYEQFLEFCERLHNLTLLEFRAPMEEEWEYAARGGDENEGYKYAGGDSPNDVAWYSENSKGVCHTNKTSDLKEPTNNDIFNMSGNLSEWCATDFRPYNSDVPVINEEAKVVRGGNYESEEWELTVYHREPMLPTTAVATVGIRLALSK